MSIAADKQVEIIISATDHASKIFDSVKRSAGTLGSSFPSVARSASSMAGSIAKSAAYAGVALAGIATTAGYAATRMGKSMLESAGGIEQQTIAFQTLTGSAEEASKIINQIIQDSKATPFEFAGLARGTQMLMSADISAENARKTILDLGDAIAATGGGQEEFNRVVQNLQQIQNVGQASAVDIKQFGFAGINIAKLLAESMGKTTEEIDSMVSAGTIGFEDIANAIDKANDEGNRYHDAMVNQSTILFGLVSTFKDTVKLNFAEIAQKSGLFDAAKSALNNLIATFENNKQKIIDFAVGIGESFQNNIIPALVDIGNKAVDVYNKFSTWIESLNPFNEKIKEIDASIGTLQSRSDILGQKIKEAVDSGAPQEFIDKLQQQKDVIDSNIDSLNKQKDAMKEAGSLYSQLKDRLSKLNEELQKHKLLIVMVAGAISGVLVAAFLAWAAAAAVAAAETMLLIAPYALVGAAVSAFAYLIYTHWDQIKAKTKELRDTVEGALSAMSATIQSKLTAAYTYTSSMIGQIIDWIEAQASRFYQIGANMIQGLIDGFKSQIPSLHSVVGRSIDDAVAAAKAAGEIHSPSRVFKRIGNYLVDGMVLGVKERKKEFNKEMASLISDGANQMAEKIVSEIDQISAWRKQLVDEEAKTGDSRNEETINQLKNNISLYENYFNQNKDLLVKYGKEIADVRRKQGMTETAILKESLNEQASELKKSKISDFISDAKTKIKDTLQVLFDTQGEKKTVFDKLSDSFKAISDYKSTIKDLQSEIHDVQKSAADEIKSINDDFKKSMGKFAGKTATSIASSIINGLSNVPSALTDIVAEYQDKMEEMTQSLGSDIADTLIEAEKNISEYKDDLFNKQKNQAEELLKLQKEHSEKRKEIEKLLSLNLTGDQKTALKEQLSELEASQSDELSALKNKQADELSEIQSKIDEENALLSSHKDDYKAFADAITEARRVASLDSIDIIKEQFNQEKIEQYNSIKEKVQALYEERDAAIQSAKETRNARIAEIKTEITETRSLLAAEIENRNKLFEKAKDKIKDQLKQILKSTSSFVSELTNEFKNIPDSLSSVLSSFSEDFATAAKAIGAKKLAKKAKKFAKANNGGVVTSTGVMGFSDGGVVPGSMSLHDTVPAMLTPGEIVFNPRKGQGISQKVEVYFMNPTVRSDNDMNTLVRVVDDAISRKLKLSNLGV